MSLIPRKSSNVSPFNFFDNDIDNLFEGFFRPMRSSEALSGVLSPKVDIKDEDNAYRVQADMPGLSKDDIEVTLDEGVLTIAATKEDEHNDEEKGKLLRRERYYGQYLRRIPLGSNIDGPNIQASFNDGVLSLLIPKLETSPSKKVSVDIK